MSESRDKTEKFLDYFGQGTKNFMGSGLTFEKWFVTGRAERYARSFGNATCEERQRRLDFVIELACEYKEILKTTFFSTAYCKAIMEDIINGDLDHALAMAKVFNFEVERKEIQDTYRPIFKRFKEMTEAGCRQGAERN